MGDKLMKLETPVQRGWNDFEAVKDAVESELGEGPYLFGEQFTMADIMIGAMFLWQRRWGVSSARPQAGDLYGPPGRTCKRHEALKPRTPD